MPFLGLNGESMDPRVKPENDMGIEDDMRDRQKP